MIAPRSQYCLLAPTSARGTNNPTLLGKSDPAPHPPTSLGSHPPSRTISDTGRLSAAARFRSAAIASNCFTARCLSIWCFFSATPSSFGQKITCKARTPSGLSVSTFYGAFPQTTLRQVGKENVIPRAL